MRNYPIETLLPPFSYPPVKAKVYFANSLRQI